MGKYIKNSEFFQFTVGLRRKDLRTTCHKGRRKERDEKPDCPQYTRLAATA